LKSILSTLTELPVRRGDACDASQCYIFNPEKQLNKLLTLYNKVGQRFTRGYAELKKAALPVLLMMSREEEENQNCQAMMDRVLRK